MRWGQVLSGQDAEILSLGRRSLRPAGSANHRHGRPIVLGPPTTDRQIGTASVRPLCLSCRMRVVLSSILLAVAATSAVAACGDGGREGSTAADTTTTEAEDSADAPGITSFTVTVPLDLDSPAAQAFAQNCAVCHTDTLAGEVDPAFVATVRDALGEGRSPDLIDFVLEGNSDTAEGLPQPPFEGHLTATEIEAILEFVATIEQ